MRRPARCTGWPSFHGQHPVGPTTTTDVGPNLPLRSGKTKFRPFRFCFFNTRFVVLFFFFFGLNVFSFFGTGTGTGIGTTLGNPNANPNPNANLNLNPNANANPTADPNPNPMAGVQAVTNPAALGASNDVRVVILSMRQNMANPAFQGHGSAALARMFEGQSDAHRHMAVQCGCVVLLCEVVRTHSADAGVCAVLFKAVRFLCQASAANCQSLLDGGMVAQIIGSLAAHSNSASLLRWACAALKALCWHPPVRPRAGQEGAVDVVVRSALLGHGNDPNVVLEAVLALRNLAAHPPNKPPIQPHRALLQRLQDVHRGNDQIVQQIGNLLAAI